MKECFDGRLKQAQLTTKDDIADLVKKAYFVEKLIKINRKLTSNKTKYVEAEKKRNDHISSDTKMENDLTSDVKLISTKRLTKVLINIYIVVQTVFLYMNHKLICYFNQFLIIFHLKMVKFIHGIKFIQECQKNLLNLHLLETLLLIEK